MSKIPYRFGVKVADSGSFSEEIKGKKFDIEGSSILKAMANYASRIPNPAIYMELKKGYIFSEGVELIPLDEHTRNLMEGKEISASREEQIEYLAGQFAKRKFYRGKLPDQLLQGQGGFREMLDIPVKPIETIYEEEKAKLKAMPKRQLNAVYLKYFQNPHTF